MPTPRLNSLSIQLSRMVNDEVTSHSLNGLEFTAALRLLAINKACGKFISQVADKTPHEIMSVFGDLLELQNFNFDGDELTLPLSLIKVIHFRPNNPAFPPMIYTDIEAWLHRDYNKDEAEGVVRWTQIGRKVFISTALNANYTGMVLKNHQDLEYDGTNDIFIPVRYDMDILQVAFEFLNTLLIKE